MKVLLINNCHWRRGGADMVYFNTASLLIEAGHKVVFFCKRKKENYPCEQEPYFVDNNKGKLWQIRNYFYNRDAAKQLEKLLEAEKPDIAHIHLIWGGLSPSILEILKEHRIPVVHTAHDYRMVCPAYLLKDGKGRVCERCKGGKFYNCMLHRCSKGSLVESLVMTMEMYHRNRRYHPASLIDGFVFVSNFSRQMHFSFDKKLENVNSVVLYNCPGEQVGDSLDLSLDTFNSYYLFYGRLSEEKGIHTLLKAFEHFPQLRLKIVGSGPIERALQAICSEKGLKNIVFLGYKTGKELYDLVAGAKYVCVPSECYENNPMTIVEAYTLGKPVIGAAIGGISEVIEDDKTGFLFKSGDVVSLSDAIRKTCVLEKEAYDRQQQNAFRFGMDNFSRERHLEKLVDFYARLLD